MSLCITRKWDSLSVRSLLKRDTDEIGGTIEDRETTSAIPLMVKDRYSSKQTYQLLTGSFFGRQDALSPRSGNKNHKM